MEIEKVFLGSEKIHLHTDLPLASFIVNKKQYTSSGNESKVSLHWQELAANAHGLRGVLLFTNASTDTITLENVVPFGVSPEHVYITGKGDHELSRTHLFVPGKLPVNVIVPDNAWDLGYCSVDLKNGQSVTGLVRRNRASIKKGTRTRFETILYPGGSVTYNFYAESAPAKWQDALAQIFQDRMLYDVEKFDNSLFEREDLKWIRHSYVMHIMMTWDKFYYDYKDGKFHLNEFVERGKKLYGGDDVISIWPTWPTLGLDQRNQFDLFKDLPGGTKKIHQLSEDLHKQNIKFFVCYNPWDESTRSENHFGGISDLIAETAADGVVLDTKAEASKELQQSADKVRKGVIMYSEGMAVPKDMSGIPSGRVHNALYYPPMLNLNKLIKPEFAIYRVAELFKEPIQREFATSFFNGYGTEINIMAPGQPDWAEEQYKYLGRTTRILRENTNNFTSRNWEPLIPTSTDSIWVNKWPQDGKILYTVYSIRPAGYKGDLFTVQPVAGQHFVDLWHHRLVQPKNQNGGWWIESETNAFNQAFLGTNNEGEVDCIAQLPELINAKRNGDKLTIQTIQKGTELRIWAGKPDYAKKPLVLKPGKNEISLSKYFDRFEGDFIIQLMDKGILLDENIITVQRGEARRISQPEKTATATNAPTGMVKIPAGKFTFKATNGDEFIPYPKQDVDSSFNMQSYYMDKFPVTNAQYKKFVDVTRYKPSDTANYLKHWVRGKIKKGEEQNPVTYISNEDAKAYAKWAGKRLPTELEWQYAAQTPELNEWPWKQSTPVKRKVEFVTSTLSTSAIEGIDSSRCNLGDGKLHAIGSYPLGANPYGLQDLVGSVWQMTNDLYMNGSFRYIIMKGGSYFKPSSSWWYVQGGPRELHYRQQLLRVSQGFERNATVGFRCVKDAQ
ncbi:MAG TPA: SUMF1/EgtB/PvdO family nonheme iron enzyme [Flavisolibacter sp.]|nr:SUMF1/EgtB/PvdO family nonheme iron enzyme [Flavisolibacter sp.]